MRSLAPALALLLAACAGAGAARDEVVGPTVVSLNPCTDAILVRLAGPRQLLAISHYSKDASSSSMEAEDAERFAATGGTVEEVLALDPDIVVASSFLAPATRTALEELGMEVITFGGTATVEDSLDQVRELAAVVGNETAGQQLVAEIEAALDKATFNRPPVEAALWQPGGIVPGEASLVGDLLRRTGFTSYAAARGMAQADYLSLEQVLADPPEVLLVAGSERGQTHPALDHLAGLQRATFDTRLIYCGGPTIIHAADRLAEIRDGIS